MGENTTSSINGAVNIEVHMEKELNYTAILHHSQKLIQKGKGLRRQRSKMKCSPSPINTSKKKPKNTQPSTCTMIHT